MKMYLVLGAIIGFFSVANASELPVLRISSEITYEVTESRMMRSDAVHRIQSIVHGTGFVLQRDEMKFIVTAGHVLAGPSNLAILGDSNRRIDLTRKGYALSGISIRVRVGDLSLRPTHLYLDRRNDIAVLQLSELDWGIISIDSFLINEVAVPAIRTMITAHGFPGDLSSPMIQAAEITEIQRDFFTINQPLTSGFSGGPVTTRPGNSLLGMITRSNVSQARVVTPAILISALDKAVNEFTEIPSSGISIMSNQ